MDVGQCGNIRLIRDASLSDKGRIHALTAVEVTMGAEAVSFRHEPSRFGEIHTRGCAPDHRRNLGASSREATAKRTRAVCFTMANALDVRTGGPLERSGSAICALQHRQGAVTDRYSQCRKG